MKKHISLILGLILLFHPVLIKPSVASAISYSLFEGYGTEKHPFLIKTANDIMTLSQAVNDGETYNGSCFLLVNDVDMSGKAFRPIGEGGNSFGGVFDGNLKKICNVSVSGIDQGKYLGFFGTLSGTVKNLTISGITVSFANSSNSSVRVSGVGGIAGRSSGNIFRSGVLDISITNTAKSISETAPGGFIGSMTAGTVSDCFSINFNWNGSGNARVSGFIGNVNNSNSKTTVKNSYAAGSFTMQTTPNAVFALGKVEKNSNLIASNNYVSHGVAKNMYSSGLTNVDIPATVKNDSEMKSGATLLGAEFVSDTNSSNSGYPKCAPETVNFFKVSEAAEDFEKYLSELKNKNGSVTADLDLPAYGLYGCGISWVSQTPSVISGSGEISDVYSDTYAALTGTFELDGNVLTKTFKFIVGTSDAAKIKADINALSVPSTVSGDFSVRTVGNLYGSVMVWSSSDNSLVSFDEAAGRVTRPENGSGDANVTVTVTGRLNDTEYSRNYLMTVSAYPDSISAVNAAKDGLTFAVLSSEEQTVVTKNLYLPKVIGDNVTVSWSASPDVISGDGTVVRSVENDTSVVLSAVLTKGDFSDTRFFNITLKKAESASEVLSDIADSLTFDKLSVQEIDKVTDDLCLPSELYGGADVLWSSDKPAVITDGGVVTRPPFCSQNEPVKLSADITLGSESVTKNFYITVLEEDGDIYYLNENFECFSAGDFPPEDSSDFKIYGNTVAAEILPNPTVSGEKSLHIYKTPSMGDTDNVYTLRIPSKVNKGLIVFETGIYLDYLPEKSFRIAGFTNIGTEITVNFIKTSTGAKVVCGSGQKEILMRRRYDFKLTVDTDNKCYTAYIDGEVVNASPRSFEYSQTNTASRSMSYFLCDFYWTHPTSETHSVYLDDVKISRRASYGELLSELLDKAELYLFKNQNINALASDIIIPDGVEFQSGDTDVISNRGKLLTENSNASFYMTVREENEPSQAALTKKYNAGTDYYLCGYGTEESPYLIESATQLYAFANNVNSGNDYSGIYFRLTRDIDLENTSWTPAGDGDSIFEGVFDGNGHTVSNVSVTGILNGKVSGFFGNLSGTVKNFGINGITVNVANRGDSTKINYIGGLAGRLKFTGCIDRCFVKNINITNTSPQNKITDCGGLAGRVESTADPCVSNSYVIDFTYNTSVNEEDSYVSGLFGRLASNSSTVINVSNCYAAGRFISDNLYKYPIAAVSSVAYANSEHVYASHGVAVVKSSSNLWDLAETRSNHIDCGYPSLYEMRAASLLGDAFQADVDMKNNGYPMLTWENTGAKKHKFICTGIVGENGVISGVNIEKLDDTSVNTEFIATVFGDGMLKRVITTRNINDFVKGANTVTINDSAAISAGETVKIFIWDGSGNFRPLMFVFEE